MKQVGLDLTLATERTRKREFLDEMNRVVPWTELTALVSPFAPVGKKGRPPFAVLTMLCIHFMQQWFGLSDPAMEEALHDVPHSREFAELDNWTTRLPDESTILTCVQSSMPPMRRWCGTAIASIGSPKRWRRWNSL